MLSGLPDYRHDQHSYPLQLASGPKVCQVLQSALEANKNALPAFTILRRRRVHPEVTTDDQVRRLGPANIPGDNLPVYWIVIFSQQGVVDWEDGCSLARAYRRVFEDFGADDVHCLVFESETSTSDHGLQKAYAME